ncbi:MAG TPA: response regulator transcription factor [Chloroflexaceae bacterium]|nr:response regulator transcription factor [Chloroflexaceae bacterium]
MEKALILVVEDEPTIVEVVVRYLQREGFRTATAGDGEGALRAVARERPDLLVLDLMLPGLDGLEVLRRVRAGGALPVVMLTARGEEIDRVLGLELGADDYITKPFSPRELVARVKAVLRRTQSATPAEGGAPPPLVVGELRLDPAARTASLAGEPVNLTSREFDLLAFLMRHVNQVFTREQLLDQVWGYTFAGDLSTVTVHIRRLREKIERDPANPSLLQTVWGVGYRLSGERGGA